MLTAPCTLPKGAIQTVLAATLCFMAGDARGQQTDPRHEFTLEAIRTHLATGVKPDIQVPSKLANTYCTPDMTVESEWIGASGGVVQAGQSVELEMRITLNNDCAFASGDAYILSANGGLIGEHLILEEVSHIDPEAVMFAFSAPGEPSYPTTGGDYFFKGWENRSSYVWNFGGSHRREYEPGYTFRLRLSFRAVQTVQTASSLAYVITYPDYYGRELTFFETLSLELEVAPAVSPMPAVTLNAFQASPGCLSSGKQFFVQANVTNHTDETKYFRLRLATGENFLPMRYGLIYSAFTGVLFNHTNYVTALDSQYPRPDLHFYYDEASSQTILRNVNLDEAPILVVPPGTFSVFLNGTGSAFLAGGTLHSNVTFEELGAPAGAPWEQVRTAPVVSSQSFPLETKFCPISTSQSELPEFVNVGDEVTFEFGAQGFHYKGLYGDMTLVGTLPDHLKVTDIEIADYGRKQAVEGEVIEREFLLRMLTYYSTQHADNGFLYQRNISPDGNTAPPEIGPDEYENHYKMFFRTHDDFKVRVTAQVVDNGCQPGNIQMSMSQFPYRAMPLDYEQNAFEPYFDYLYFEFLKETFADPSLTVMEKKDRIYGDLTGTFREFRDNLYYRVQSEIIQFDASFRAPLTTNCSVSSLSGTKWRDEDGDGAFDEGEPTMQGWTVTARRVGGGPWGYGVEHASTVTDAQGRWELAGLMPGEWEVTESFPAEGGWVQTFPGDGAGQRHRVTVQGGEHRMGLDFGNRQPTVIAGVKWNDLDGDGYEGPGEPRLPGWRIFVDLDGDGEWDEGEPWAETDRDGAFRIEEPPNGEHALREVLPADGSWRQSRPGPGTGHGYPVTVRRGWPVEPNGFLFGNFEPAGIAGVKWRDRDGDGRIGPDEPLLPGWTVFLDADGDGAPSAGEPRAVTDETGGYVFEGLDPGTYRVGEVNSAGWVQTWPREGLHTVAVLGGQTGRADFGNATEEDARFFNDPDSFAIVGNVFYEHVEDGGWRAGETKVPGWLVHLQGISESNGHVRLSTFSDERGAWRFSGIPEGEYRVTREARQEWVSSFPLLADQDPAGQPHIVETVAGYVGVDSTAGRIYAGFSRGWLDGLRAGADELYAGMFLDLDVDADGAADERLFLSGPVHIRWEAAAGGRAGWELEFMNLVGESPRYGRVRATLPQFARAAGLLRASGADSLADSRIGIPVRLDLGGEAVETEAGGIRVRGGVAAMLPYNQPHSSADTSAALRDVYGRVRASVLRMSFHPLFAADFGVNNSIFGWAADRYPVALEDRGARHVLDARGRAGVVLGGGFAFPQISVRTRASAARQAGLRGEDGVAFLTPLVPGSRAAVRVTASAAARLAGWVDFDGDGAWAGSERILAGEVPAGESEFTFDVPAAAVPGGTYARFRITLDAAPPGPAGAVFNGEVEDYAVSVGAGAGAVSGGVWNDLDADGLRDPGEPPLQGVAVFADLNGNGAADSFEPQGATGADGAYRLAGLPVGVVVSVATGAGAQWRVTSPAGGPAASVDLTLSAQADGVDFGLARVSTSAGGEAPGLPQAVALSPNFPNPFNPVTVIPFELPAAGPVELSVYDALGRRVATLVDGPVRAGFHQVAFDASALTSGVYVVRLRAGTVLQSKKMTLMK